MRALPRLRRSPLAAAVRDRISQKKGQRQQALGRMRIAARRTRGLLHLARQHGAFGRRLGREPGHGFARARVRRARPSPTAANRNRATQALTRRRTAHQPACPREARTGREVALPLAACLSACFLSVRLRGRRLRTRWLGALGLCSRHLRRRRLHGTRAGAATCPLAARRALRSARGVGGASSSTNMDSESDGMAGGIGDGVMPRQIRLPMPTCKAQASKAAIHDVARLPRAFPPSQPRPLTWPAASIGTICNTRLTSPIPRATGDDSPRAGEDL